MFDRQKVDGSRVFTALLALSALAAAALLVAGCGGGGSSSGSGGSTGSSGEEGGSSEMARYEKELAAAFKGTSTLPTGGPVKKDTSGKNVWIISVGLGSEATEFSTEAMQEVGEGLGWNVTLYDAKFEANREVTGGEQAIAAGAEGIILDYIDCEPIRAPLEQAKKAGISVVGLESRDCSPSLETPVLYGGGMGFEEWTRKWSEYTAIYIAAKTEGKAKVIATTETDVVTSKIDGEAFREYMENKCPECEIVEEIKFVAASFGSLQGKIEQALTKHPEANAFNSSSDAVMTVGGGAAALRASGRLGEIVSAGGEGSAPGIELIRNEEGLDACSGINLSWEGYASATVLARIFAGEDPSKTNAGIGWQLCDREHNLPPKGSGYQPSVDFVGAYEKILGIPLKG